MTIRNGTGKKLFLSRFLQLFFLFIAILPLATSINADDCTVPSEATLIDTSSPDTVVGNGTPASCTSEAFVAAVAGGGTITFDCGSAPKTITLTETAKIFNT